MSTQSGPEDNPSDGQPWDRQTGESDRAYAAFLIYRDLGPRRSLDAARQTLGKPSGYVRALEEWSSRWGWVERARAHDRHLERLREEALQDIVRAEAAKWELRRQAEVDRRWELSRKLAARIEEMLAFPIATETTETSPDGKTVKIVHPARWNFRDILAAVETSAELAESVLRGLDKDVSEMSEAELEGIADPHRYAEGEPKDGDDLV